MADALERVAKEELWSQQTRAEFVQRHFEIRQNDIIKMIGDPAATDLGDLLPEAPRRERVTRDEFKTVAASRQPPPPLEEERTVEVRTLTAKVPEPRPPNAGKDGRAQTIDGRALSRKMPIRPPGYPEDEPATVLGPPPVPEPEPRKGLAPAPALKGSNRRTEPALEAATAEGRPPIDSIQPSTESRAIPDEGSTMIEDDSSRATDEHSEKRELAPGRQRLRNLAAQKQALLMWIAIGSGLVLGLVLAAFLIFG
jgi:hypothetical protein